MSAALGELRLDRGPDLAPGALARHRRVRAQHPDAVTVAEREDAIGDGYGIRVLCADPAMPRERARVEIWAAVEPELH